MATVKYFDSDMVNLAEINNIGVNLCTDDAIFGNFMTFSCTNSTVTSSISA